MQPFYFFCHFPPRLPNWTGHSACIVVTVGANSYCYSGEGLDKRTVLWHTANRVWVPFPISLCVMYVSCEFTLYSLASACCIQFLFKNLRSAVSYRNATWELQLTFHLSHFFFFTSNSFTFDFLSRSQILSHTVVLNVLWYHQERFTAQKRNMIMCGESYSLHQQSVCFSYAWNH